MPLLGDKDDLFQQTLSNNVTLQTDRNDPQKNGTSRLQNKPSFTGLSSNPNGFEDPNFASKQLDSVNEITRRVHFADMEAKPKYQSNEGQQLKPS